MQKFFNNFNNNHDFFEEMKIKEYIFKYIRELQRHFDVSDNRMRNILYKIYKELSPFNYIKNFLKNNFDMLKSFYISKRNIK